jgi:deoxycytidine triphosphate deaminase
LGWSTVLPTPAEMANILPDRDLNLLLEKCIVHSHKDCVKTNTYELRLGDKARFRNSDEVVELKPGEYLEVGPGETVDLTSLEVIDFRQESVAAVFPGRALMGFLTSRTTLMREGISFAPTKIDPGFYGTLDWVFKNHDFRSVMLPYGERLVNLIVFQLDPREVPDFQYGTRNTDHYQGSRGLQPSARNLPAQIPDGLIKRQSKKPEDASRRIRDYGPPLSWVGTELETLAQQFRDLSGKVENFMPKIESLIGDRFNRAYAFVLGVAGLLGTVIVLLQKYESYWWPPLLLGGLSLICLSVALFVRPRK